MHIFQKITKHCNQCAKLEKRGENGNINLLNHSNINICLDLRNAVERKYIAKEGHAGNIEDSNCARFYCTSSNSFNLDSFEKI